jgi:predicted RNA-binding protein with PIN domain
MPESKRARLEDQRLDLVRFIEKHSPQGSLKNSVTIVFDGSMNVVGGMVSPAAKILFSQGESADDKIRTIVAQAKNKKNIIVVTDDRDIQYAVRALGAQVIGVEDFLSKGKLPGKKGSSVSKGLKRKVRDPSASEKYISKTVESKITAELGKIWLKSKEGPKN